MALYCWQLEEEDDNEEFVHPRSVLQSTRQLLEVGTLAQIRATHEYKQTTQQGQQPQPTSSGNAQQRRLGSLFSSSPHSTNSSVWNSGTWHIPHFSVYRFSHCQFLLYQQKKRKMKSKKNTFPKHANDDADNNDKGSVELHYLATTAPIHITSVTSPFGIHLSGTSNPSEMVVSFSTRSGHAGLTNAMVAVVVYGTSVGNHEYDYLTGGTKDPSVVVPPPSSSRYHHHHHTNNNHENGHSSNDVPDSEYNGFHPAWGNFENDSGGECGVPTTKRFTMPQRNEDASLLPPSNGVFWYSHDFGNVHTIVLSSEHDLSFGIPGPWPICLAA